MRRFTPFFIVILILASLALAGCGQESNETYTQEASDDAATIRVIATIFPQYDFVRQIAGDRVELGMLISPGMESHGFEPTPRNIIDINDADLLIYVGGHGDTWVYPILASIDRQDMRTVALIDLVDAVHQEVIEGMEVYHDHGHSHDHHHHDDHDHDEHHHHGDENHHDSHDHDHHHDHSKEYDEHVWTSPRNAILIVQALTDVLSEMNPENKEFFRENAAVYIAQLQELDAAFAEVVAQGERDIVIFGDRFPFRYLVDTYGLRYYAAFSGCSAETQASPATIAFLIEKMREENIPVVFHIEFSNLAIANTIAEDTGARLIELHSAHNVSHADFAAGITYLDLMWRNVENLREGLN